MSADTIREHVRAVIAQALGLTLEDLPAGADTDTVDRWDSLGHIEIIEALSQSFAISIPYAQAVTLLSEDAIVEAIAAAR